MKIVIWGTKKRAEIFIDKILNGFADIVEIVAVTSNEEKIEGCRIGNRNYIFVKPEDLGNSEFDFCIICSAAIVSIVSQIINNHYIPISKVKTEDEAYKIIIAEKMRNKEMLEADLKNRFLKKHIDDKQIKLLPEYEYINKYGIKMYPYEWFYKLPDEISEVYEEDGMRYIVYKGKKCFYPNEYTDERILESANFFIKEQNKKSPHCYLPDGMSMKDYIVVDGGSAEANFTLDIIDEVKKVYVVEGDGIWQEPLRRTFKEYEDKVVIVDKYLDSYAHDNCDTIDNIVKENKIDFIKMDIEGYELKALYGAKEHIFNSDNLKMSICAYHNPEDADVITAYLESLGFDYEFGLGYIFRMDDSIWKASYPEMRKGMIYAKKRR